jgi:RNA-binding protein NOB1
MSKADFLVVDSGGFIKAAPLRELADHIVTLHDVVNEIRDKETRKRLQVGA